jgi:arabinan endo-1,5-alpha-L-arabinosidase
MALSVFRESPSPLSHRNSTYTEPRTSLAYNLIDPNLYILNGPTGPTYFLTFGSYWDGKYQAPPLFPQKKPPLNLLPGIYQIPMTDPLTIAPHANPQNLAFNPDGIHPVEGSYQFWWPTNGIPYYYLFLSVGICCNQPPNLPPPGQEYHITVCRSISPTGPFTDRNGDDCLAGGGTTVLASHDDVYAPGGEGVLYDAEENSIVLYYHYINPKIGYGVENYQFGYNLLTMDDLGWPVLV